MWIVGGWGRVGVKNVCCALHFRFEMPIGGCGECGGSTNLFDEVVGI